MKKIVYTLLFGVFIFQASGAMQPDDANLNQICREYFQGNRYLSDIAQAGGGIDAEGYLPLLRGLLSRPGILYGEIDGLLANEGIRNWIIDNCPELTAEVIYRILDIGVPNEKLYDLLNRLHRLEVENTNWDRLTRIALSANEYRYMIPDWIAMNCTRPTSEIVCGIIGCVNPNIARSFLDRLKRVEGDNIDWDRLIRSGRRAAGWIVNNHPGVTPEIIYRLIHVIPNEDEDVPVLLDKLRHLEGDNIDWGRLAEAVNSYANDESSLPNQIADKCPEQGLTAEIIYRIVCSVSGERVYRLLDRLRQLEGGNIHLDRLVEHYDEYNESCAKIASWIAMHYPEMVFKSMKRFFE